INLLDTPGHIDFTMEVEQSLYAVDGVVVVLDGTAGVEAQTVTVWSQADKHKLPRLIFVNKMDRPDADFEKCVSDLKDKLETQPVCLQYPVKNEDGVLAINDVITLERLSWQQKDLGRSYRNVKLEPSDDLRVLQEKRNELIDQLSGLDDELADVVISTESFDNVDNALIERALRRATTQQKVVPVLLGSAYKNVGIQRLMDAVNAYLPAPEERNQIYDCFGLDKSPENLPNLNTLRPRILQVLRKGSISALERGPRVGGQVVETQIRLHNATIGRGTADSFVMATAAQCVQKLLSTSGTRLLEPIMALQIVAPSERISGIIADLSRRRAHINDVLPKGERNKIKRIMDQRYDPEKSKALKKKIKQLADDNKITPQDEKELNGLQAAIDDMNKAHDILEAENANLKRLLEKQSKRCKMDSIKIDPEKSNDIPYLQKKIDDLGKEVALLREFEDEVMKRCAKKCGSEGGGGGGGGGGNAGRAARGPPGKGSFSPDKDAENIKKILADRDALRKKCKELEELGCKVNQLEEKANEAECLTCNLEENLRKQCRCMEQMQCEMHDMQNYYENEVDKARGNEEILKCRCNQMKQELVAAKCAVQRAQCQQMEIEVLRNELRKRDTALNAYDCQFQQIMMKAKMFKAAGYRFLDDLPPDCSESCVDGPGEEEEGN
ncbi:GD20968, partial [Drosophila simulans]